MRRALVLVLVLGIASTPASADGFYFTEGLGGTDVKNDLGAYMPAAVHLRFAAGWRQGAWAIQADLGAHLAIEDGPAAARERDRQSYDFYSLFTWGVDLKYIQPVGEHLETYLRGGLSYAVLDPILDDEYAGRGVRGGAGIQLKGKVRALGFLAWPFFFLKIGPKVTAALWLDAGYDFYRLHPGGARAATPAPGTSHASERAEVIDAELTSISGGFAIGSDF